MSQACRRIAPSYKKLRETLSRHLPSGLFQSTRSKGSSTKKDTVVRVIELYESDGKAATMPTNKDFYETSVTLPSRTLQPSQEESRIGSHSSGSDTLHEDNSHLQP